MTGPTWTILIPTIAPREHLLLRLLDVLLPQLDQAAGAVRVLAWRNAGERSIGEIRDAMVVAAESDYVSFIDDDDLVAADYVPAVLDALGQRPDHVGFRVEFVTDSGREIVDHSLRHGRWHRNADGELVRDFTHIDPVLRDIAMRGRFAAARAGRAEDRAWCRQVRPFLQSEVYLDRVMYHYLWSASITAWQRPELVPAPTGPRPAVDHPHFRWHPESL